MRPPLRLAAVVLLFAAAGDPGWSQDAIPSGPELEASGARIGRIRVSRFNIFDTTDPEEDYFLYRLANRLHVVTREDVIRRELLFREGEPYRHDLIEESERNLRALSVVYHVRIVPEAVHGGLVDLVVQTQDTWTMRPSVRISRAGGDTRTGFSFSELNFLGRVKLLQLSHRNDVDRSTDEVLYSDPRLFGTRFALRTLYQDSSDGLSRGLSISRPFFSLDSRWAMTASGQHLEQTTRLFESGEDIAEFHQFSETLHLSYARSPGFRDDRVFRFGFGYSYQRNVFSQDPGDEGFGIVPIPENQKFSGPVFTFERLKARYVEVTYYNQFDRVEDFNLGNDFKLSLQASLRGLGSSRGEMLLSVSDSFGISLSRSTNLFYSVSLSGRTGEGEVRNVLFSQVVEAYYRATQRQTLYSRVAFDAGIHLDSQVQLLLGGDTGLRGYPTREFAGDRRLLLTLEHRYFSDLEILRLVRIGVAGFVDVGNAWYGTTGQRLRDLHSDLGVGLRFGVTRSSVASVSRLDLAYSVDAEETDSPRLQLLFGTSLKF
jgi:outer membrane protein assembly factor BamA